MRRASWTWRISRCPPADLLARSQSRAFTEEDLAAFLNECADVADTENPTLALLLRILAECPLEVAAFWHTHLWELSGRISDDDAGVAQAAATALAQFAEDEGHEDPDAHA